MTRSRAATLVAAVTVLASACTAAANGGEHASADTLVYTGVVQQSGASIDRAVVLQQHGGDPVRLSGELAHELAQLAGGTVRVEGFWTGTQGGSLDVRNYELLTIGGGVPVVGVVEDRNGELWLGGTPALRLIGAPAELRSQVGARVWVVGEQDGGALRLQSYGVIAAP